MSSLELSKLAGFYALSLSELLQGAVEDEDGDAQVARRVAALGRRQDSATRLEVARCFRLYRDGIALARLLGASEGTCEHKCLSELGASSTMVDPDKRREWERELQAEVARLAIEAYRRSEFSAVACWTSAGLSGLGGTASCASQRLHARKPSDRHRREGPEAVRLALTRRAGASHCRRLPTRRCVSRALRPGRRSASGRPEAEPREAVTGGCRRHGPRFRAGRRVP